MKQFWSKSLACLLCLALLAGMLPVAALAEDNPPAKGEVSLADAATDTPIEIDSADELAKIGADGYPLTGSYVLADDIDLEGSADNAWKSIGNFTGTFDGDGHTISGLYLNADSVGPADRGAGLFTMVGEGGTVRNLTVEGKIEPTGLGRKPIGGIVGRNNGGTISSCTGSVVVKGDAGFSVGGVVGQNNGGTISSCIGSVVVNGNANFSVGGIVGSSESGTIENCRNTGSIDVTGRSTDSANGIGGIVGTNNGTVENCENTGKVTVGGMGVIGGIVGRANGSSKVSNCRNSGCIRANGGAAQPAASWGITTALFLSATTPALSPATVPQAASQEIIMAQATAPTASLRTATTPAPSAAAATLAASWGIPTTATRIHVSPQSKIATTPAKLPALAILAAPWGESKQAMSATAIT